ncbi:uncharacterized protein B0H18DRAFT_955253 [Fomitopsis serialis]|uniref:uncharacterized protein n=1 Tax=Fomitopsis serialis TaxID=139415 RepID=UPI002007BCEE|nr:uncharacterized protein B0H18DRAFT_955253 [Neoantrodia serialis]KAH9925208.1 hypothetical protein B0H18DRAFT_955253 [Neoantrodia serialis]
MHVPPHAYSKISTSAPGSIAVRHEYGIFIPKVGYSICKVLSPPSVRIISYQCFAEKVRMEYLEHRREDDMGVLHRREPRSGERGRFPQQPRYLGWTCSTLLRINTTYDDQYAMDAHRMTLLKPAGRGRQARRREDWTFIRIAVVVDILSPLLGGGGG